MLLQGVGGQTMSFYVGNMGAATYRLYHADGTVTVGAGGVVVVLDNAQPVATVSFTGGELSVLGTLLVCVLDSAGVLNGDQEDVVPGYPPANFATASRAALGMAGANLDAQLSAINALAVPAAVRAALGMAAANLDAQLATLAVPGSAMTLTGGADTAIATAVWTLANAIETGLTPAGAMRLLAAVSAGIVSLAPGVATFRGAGVVTNRVVASIPGDGSRPAMTLTP